MEEHAKAIVYLLIRRIHCWDAFSLSQSVLKVGSQDVAWIWDKRPAPATPATPNPIPLGSAAVVATLVGTGMGKPTAVLRTPPTMFPKPLPTAKDVVSVEPGAITARPVSAAAAGGGEAGLAALVECPGSELPKLGNSGVPLPWLPTTPKPIAPFVSSPKIGRAHV